MILAAYVAVATLATLMVALTCWVPAVALGVAMLWLVLCPEIRRFSGWLRSLGLLRERRAPDGDQRLARLL